MPAHLGRQPFYRPPPLTVNTIHAQKYFEEEESSILDDDILDHSGIDSGLEMSPPLANGTRDSFVLSSPKMDEWHKSAEMQSLPSNNPFLEQHFSIAEAAQGQRSPYVVPDRVMAAPNSFAARRPAATYLPAFSLSSPDTPDSQRRPESASHTTERHTSYTISADCTEEWKVQKQRLCALSRDHHVVLGKRRSECFDIGAWKRGRTRTVGFDPEETDFLASGQAYGPSGHTGLNISEASHATLGIDITSLTVANSAAGEHLFEGSFPPAGLVSPVQRTQVVEPTQRFPPLFTTFISGLLATFIPNSFASFIYIPIVISAITKFGILSTSWPPSPIDGTSSWPDDSLASISPSSEPETLVTGRLLTPVANRGSRAHEDISARHGNGIGVLGDKTRLAALRGTLASDQIRRLQSVRGLFQE